MLTKINHLVFTVLAHVAVGLLIGVFGIAALVGSGG